MSYDSWKLDNPPEYDLPLRICECGKECDGDATICDDCKDEAWKSRDALGFSLAQIVELEG